MTFRRIGSGGSAVSPLLFAAGFAAAAGFGGAAVAAAFGVGGAVVLPSTESAMIPLFYLLVRNINRAYEVLISL